MNKTLPTCSARLATMDDFAEITLLLNGIFNLNQNPKTLRWKFMGSLNRMAGSAVLTSDHKIVGFLGQIPVRVSIDGRESLAAQGADMAIQEPFRRIDAFMALLHASIGELEKAGVVMTYGTANASALLPLSTLLGQQSIATIPLLVRPLNSKFPTPSMLGTHVLTGILEAGSLAMEYGTRLMTTITGHSLRLTCLDRFDGRFDSFWHRIQNDYRIQLVRDAAYLNWRYVDAPGVVYERLSIEHVPSGAIEGYAVLCLRRRGDQLRGSLCDLVTPRADRSLATHALITAALKWFRAHHAAIAEAWALPGSHLRTALQCHGFVPRSKGQPGFQAAFIASGTDTPHQAFYRAENWFLAMGDSDRV